MCWGALLLPHHNSWVVKLIFANALAAPRLRFSHRACVRAQGERCVSDAAGEEATCSDTEWDIAAGFGREGVLMGEGSGAGAGAAGAAGGTRLCRNTCAGKQPHARARIWETNVGHGYETASGVWGPGYTEKDLAASSQPARCHAGSQRCSFGGEDEQSGAGVTTREGSPEQCCCLRAHGTGTGKFESARRGSAVSWEVWRTCLPVQRMKCSAYLVRARGGERGFAHRLCIPAWGEA